VVGDIRAISHIDQPAPTYLPTVCDSCVPSIERQKSGKLTSNGDYGRRSSSEEDSRRRLGRGLTREELERVLRRYPGNHAAGRSPSRRHTYRDVAS
jgi:hypothetical protein